MVTWKREKRRYDTIRNVSINGNRQRGSSNRRKMDGRGERKPRTVSKSWSERGRKFRPNERGNPTVLERK